MLRAMFSQDLTADFHEKAGAFLDYATKTVDKGFDLNKQISAFHERLTLVSFGTLSLSITALTALIPKVAGASFPRHSFVKFVIPAWILLFVSIVFSRAVMGHILVASRQLLDQWKGLGEAHTVKGLVRAVTELSQKVSGTTVVDGKEQAVADTLADVAKKLDSYIHVPTDLDVEKVRKAAERTAKSVKWLSTVAVLSLEAALVLLGIAAIKLFLSV
jgi:hypothetical protein